MNCRTGKVRHASEEAARIAQTRTSYGHTLTPYPCPQCDGWHLGGHHREHHGDTLAQFARSEWHKGCSLSTPLADKLEPGAAEKLRNIGKAGTGDG